MPDESYFDAADLLGEVFVETDQTVCCKNLALWKLGVFRITYLLTIFSSFAKC